MTVLSSRARGLRRVADEHLPRDTPPSGGADAQLSSAARGGALNLFGSIITAIAQFGFVLLVTRSLGATGSGSLLIALAIFQIVGRSAELGVATGLIRWITHSRVRGRVPEIRAVLPAALGPALGIGAVFGLALWLGAARLADSFQAAGTPDGALAEQLRLLAPFVPVLALYSAMVNGCRGFATMRPTVVIDRIAKPVLQPLLVGGLLLLGVSSRWLVVGWAAPIVLLVAPATIWFAHLLRRSERGASSAPLDRVERPGSLLRREFWSFTLPRSFSGIFQISITWFDTILVGAIASAAAAGIYSAAIRYLMVGTFVVLAIGQSVQPLVSEAFARSDLNSARELFQMSASWVVMSLLPIYTLVAIFAPTLLAVFGPEFVDAVPALVILASATALAAPGGPAATILLMGGRSLLSSLNMGLSLAANVGLNLVLIPAYGITGAALAFAVSIVVGKILPVLQVYFTMGLHPFGFATLRVMVLALGVFGGIGGALRLAFGGGLPTLLVTTIVATGCYGILLVRQKERLGLDVVLSIYRPRR